MRTSLSKPSGQNAPSHPRPLTDAVLRCTFDRPEYADFHSTTMAYISPKAIALSAPVGAT